MGLFDNQYQNQLYNFRSTAAARIIEQELEAQNEVVVRWRPKVRRALKRSASEFPYGKNKSMVTRGPRKEQKLSRSITSKIKKVDGAAEYISFNFERHGVFVHKGVGSGYQMQAGKVVRIAQTDSGNRREPEEWFTPVLDKYMPQLADKLAEVNANLSINFEKSRIK